MKLYYSPNSPYARVARIAAMESALADDVQHIRVVNRAPDNPLQKLSPTARVPTLVDGDLVLAETRHICAYLDHLQHADQFFPAGEPNWQLLSTEGTVLAFLDSIVAQVSERRRPPNSYSSKRIAHEERKARRCLDLFEHLAKNRHDLFMPWDFTGISLAAALGLMKFHSFTPQWHSKYPRLADWYLVASRRPAMSLTSPE